MTDPIVDTAWLADHLADPDLVVFDATLYLPHEGRDAHREYLALHIPGAAFFDIDLFGDPDSDLPHTVPGAARFARLAGEHGVSDRSMVVFYDQRGLFSAARGWWLMRLFGHDRVAVLDGGLPKWRTEGRPTDAGAPPAPRPAIFPPTFRAQMLRGIGDLLTNVAVPHELVLDARAAGRFAGQMPEPRPGVTPGHIPGSRNLPFTELLSPDQTLLPPAALRERFAAAGVTDGTKVVTSCGSGVTATVLTLAMVRAGFPPGAVYDGSWTEWGSRQETPKESQPDAR